MKIHEIMEPLEESPVLLGPAPTEWTKQHLNTTSDSTLGREYTMLGDIELDNGEVLKFYLSKDRTNARAVLSKPNSERNSIVVRITFVENSDMKVPSEYVQVSAIAANPKYGSSGYAGTFYGLVAKTGISVVSDFQQYDGGKALWKSIAKNLTEFEVKLWDHSSDSWLTDNAGNAIIYDGSNVPDDDIWDVNGKINIVLVLSAKSS